MNAEQRSQAVDEIFEYLEEMFYIGEVKAWEEVKVAVCVDSMKKRFTDLIAAHDKQPSGDFGEPLEFKSGVHPKGTCGNEDDERWAQIDSLKTGKTVAAFDEYGITDKMGQRFVACVNALANRDPGKVEAVIDAANKFLDATDHFEAHDTSYIKAKEALEAAIKGVE